MMKRRHFVGLALILGQSWAWAVYLPDRVLSMVLSGLGGMVVGLWVAWIDIRERQNALGLQELARRAVAEDPELFSQLISEGLPSPAVMSWNSPDQTETRTWPIGVIACGGSPPPNHEGPFPTRCPKCGGELGQGFGLAGGGYGAYTFCMTDECDYFAKRQEEE